MNEKILKKFFENYHYFYILRNFIRYENWDYTCQSRPRLTSIEFLKRYKLIKKVGNFDKKNNKNPIYEATPEGIKAYEFMSSIKKL